MKCLLAGKPDADMTPMAGVGKQMEHQVSRRTLLAMTGAMATTVLLPQTLFAQRGPDGKPLKSPIPAFDNDPLTVESLSDNLKVIRGMGGNIAALMGEDGVLLIDSGVPTRGQDVVILAKGFSTKGITTLVNTHFHFDHTGGNEAVGAETTRIIGHGQTRIRMQSPQTIELIGLTVPASPKPAWPTVTFEDKLTIFANGQTLHLTHAPDAHTDSDVFVHLEELDTIHLGDLFFNGFYPVIDYSSMGWIGGMIDGIQAALPLIGAQTKVIPGHGATASIGDVSAYLGMLGTVRDKVTPLVEAGKSVEEIVAAKPTKELDEKWGNGLLKPDVFVADVATSIIRHAG